MASGVDQNRLSLLLAVLGKRAGLNLVADDVFVNVAGGIAVDEPAADLAGQPRLPLGAAADHDGVGARHLQRADGLVE